MRDAVGPDVTLLVDCHSRFDIEPAVIVAEELAGLGVGWFEEPVQPLEDPAGMARIAARVPMPVAGGEKGYGEGLFAELIDRGAVSVIMPDVKHCGGVAVAARAGRAAIDALAAGCRSTARPGLCRSWPAGTSLRPCPAPCRWSTLSTRRTGGRTCSRRRSGSRTAACTSRDRPGWAPS